MTKEGTVIGNRVRHSGLGSKDILGGSSEKLRGKKSKTRKGEEGPSHRIPENMKT